MLLAGCPLPGHCAGPFWCGLIRPLGLTVWFLLHQGHLTVFMRVLIVVLFFDFDVLVSNFPGTEGAVFGCANDPDTPH